MKNKKQSFFNNVVRLICLWICKLICPWLYMMKVEGRENMPEEGGVLMCANHKNLIDPILVEVAVKKRYIYYFCKNALTKNKVGKWFFEKALLTKSVSHTGADIMALKWGVNNIKEGNIVGIFPEGTRNKTENLLLDFQQGAAIIAHMAKATVVPVAVVSSYKPFKKSRIIIGKPLDLSEEYSKKLDAGVKEDISKKIYDFLQKNLKK